MQRRKKSYPQFVKTFCALSILTAMVNFVRAADLTAPIASEQNILSAIEKEETVPQRNPLLLLHEKWTHRQLNVFASYETPWHDSAVLPKISEYQEPGCASIKASFSF